jgi:branched-chain amino acid transport system substrate-binding protein
MMSSRLYVRRVLLVAAATWLTACSTAATPATPPPDTDLSSVIPPTAAIDAGALFTGGTLGTASGSPLRVGWVDIDNGSNSTANTQAVTAAVTMVNTELNGVGGRPIELVTCARQQQLRACSAALAADPQIAVVITGNVGEFGAGLRENLGDLPRVGVIATQDDEYRDPLNAFFVLGTPGILRAAVTWLIAGSPTGTTVEHVTILVTPRDSDVAGTYAGERLKRVGIEVSVVVVDDVLPGERVLRDVRTAVDALDPESAVVNMLGPTGCVALAEALRAAGKDVLVVTSGLCSSKSVHDKLGDWTPGWIHIAGGPDLARYDQDPQAALYRDRLRLYAGPEADWTGHSSLSFAAVLNVVRILSGLAADRGDISLSDRGLVARALSSYQGPLFTGAGTANCGLDQQRPALCQHQARAYRYESGRHWVDVTGEALLSVYP